MNFAWLTKLTGPLILRQTSLFNLTSTSRYTPCLHWSFLSHGISQSVKLAEVVFGVVGGAASYQDINDYKYNRLKMHTVEWLGKV